MVSLTKSGGSGPDRAGAVPRRLTIVAGALGVLACLGAILAPPVLLLSQSRGWSGFLYLFREGGGFMYVVPPAQALGALLLAVVGFFLIKGSRLPAGLVLLPAGLPLLAGLAGHGLALRRVAEAVEYADPYSRSLLLARGIAETLSLHLSGGLGVCSLLGAATLILLLAQLTVNPPAAVEASPPATLRPWENPLLLALAAFLVSLLLLTGVAVTQFLLHVRLTPLDPVRYLVLLGAMGGSVLLAVSCAGLHRLEPEAAGRLWRQVALAPFLLAGTLGLLGVAALALEQRQLFEAVANVSPTERGPLLAMARAELGLRQLLVGADVVAALLLLGLPLVAAGRVALQGLTQLRLGAAVTALLGLLGIGLVLLPDYQAHTLLAAAAPDETRFAAAGELPRLAGAETRDPVDPAEPLLLVPPGGNLLWQAGQVGPRAAGSRHEPVPFTPALLAQATAPPPADRSRASALAWRPEPVDRERTLIVAASRELTLAGLFQALEPVLRAGALPVRLVTEQPVPINRAELGTFGLLLPDAHTTWPVRLTPSLEQLFTPLASAPAEPREPAASPAEEREPAASPAEEREPAASPAEEREPAAAQDRARRAAQLGMAGLLRDASWSTPGHGYVVLQVEAGQGRLFTLPLQQAPRTAPFDGTPANLTHWQEQIRQLRQAQRELGRLLFAPPPNQQLEATLAQALQLADPEPRGDEQGQRGSGPPPELVLTLDHAGLTQVATQPPAAAREGTLDGIGGIGFGGLRGAGLGKPGERRPGVVTGAAEIQGGCAKEVVRRVVRARQNGIRYCYEQELSKSPQLAGKILVRWTIGPAGQVLQASVASSTLNSPAVEECLIRQIKRWQFPQPQGGGACQINYPFLFRSRE